VAQLPVQHSSAAAHAVPVVLQDVLAHRPLTHACEQHSLGVAHAAPGDLQNAVVVQVPAPVAPVGLLQAFEQHSGPAVQAPPDAVQVDVGVAHCWVSGLQ
jgi:hypothetical protein